LDGTDEGILSVKFDLAFDEPILEVLSSQIAFGNELRIETRKLHKVVKLEIEVIERFLDHLSAKAP
jgi:hypothetical protein